MKLLWFQFEIICQSYPRREDKPGRREQFKKWLTATIFIVLWSLCSRLTLTVLVESYAKPARESAIFSVSNLLLILIRQISKMYWNIPRPHQSVRTVPPAQQPVIRLYCPPYESWRSSTMKLTRLLWPDLYEGDQGGCTKICNRSSCDSQRGHLWWHVADIHSRIDNIQVTSM